MPPVRALALIVAFAAIGCDNTIRDHFAGSGVVSLGKPTSLTGLPVLTGLSVHLTWTDNAMGESGYRVEGDTVPFGANPPSLTISTAANATSTDVAAQPNTTYYFRVLAVFGAQASPPSEVVIVITPDVPSPPGNLTAIAVSSSRIDLEWVNSGGGVMGNRVERSLDGGTNWTTRFTFGSPTLSASDTGLSPDTTYSYRVAASNANGEGGPSSPASATTLTDSMTFRTTSTPGSVVGQYTSISVTPAGIAHIAHFDATNTNLLYSTTTADPLPNTTVDAGPSGTQAVGGDGTGIALDTSGHAHLVAHDTTSGKLRYVTNSSGAFVSSTLDSAGFNGQAPGIAISPVDGSIHVVYLNDLPGGDTLRHASRTPPAVTWTFEDILPSSTTLDFWAMTIDASGHIHVSYSHTNDGVQYELVHAVRSGSWAFSSVTSAAHPARNSIAVDASGTPHISYFEQTNGRLMHATQAGSLWSTEVVHGVGGVDLGRYNSIAINPVTGRIHIGYSDATNGDLLYARKDPAGAWVRKLIDVSGSVGNYPSVGIDGSGQVHIAYYDAGNGELRLASGSP